MEEILLYGLGLFLLSRFRSKDDEQEPNGGTTPVIVDVPFTAENVNKFKFGQTKRWEDRNLAKSARKITPSGTLDNILNGTFRCLDPFAPARVAAIRQSDAKVEQLRIKKQNSTGERKQEYTKDYNEEVERRAILVAEHLTLCQAFLNRLKTPEQAFSPDSTASQQRMS